MAAEKVEQNTQGVSAAVRLPRVTIRLKKLVRDMIDPSRDLGHVDRHETPNTGPPNDYALDSDKIKPQTTAPASKAEVGIKTGVDRDAIPTAAEAATAEGMVADIMSSFHDTSLSKESHIKTGTGKESAQGQSRAVPPGTSSASERAGGVVASIVSSFQEASSVSEDTRDIGGGSGGLGTGQVADEDDGKEGIKGKERSSQKAIQGARHECEDCG
ncbi:MAG: hypothetical protein Q9183_000129 [Haloplaca sp. 2 TL-2023]